MTTTHLEVPGRKFWKIKMEGADTTVTFGKVGTSGQSSSKSHGDAAKAQKFYNKMVKAKTKKGYLPVAGGAACAEGKENAAPAANGKKKAAVASKPKKPAKKFVAMKPFVQRPFAEVLPEDFDGRWEHNEPDVHSEVTIQMEEPKSVETLKPNWRGEMRKETTWTTKKWGIRVTWPDQASSWSPAWRVRADSYGSSSQGYDNGLKGSGKLTLVSWNGKPVESVDLAELKQVFEKQQACTLGLRRSVEGRKHRLEILDGEAGGDLKMSPNLPGAESSYNEEITHALKRKEGALVWEQLNEDGSVKKRLGVLKKKTKDCMEWEWTAGEASKTISYALKDSLFQGRKYLECKQGNSSKFWMIVLGRSGNDWKSTVTFGKIGTFGKSKGTSHDSNREGVKFYEKSVNGKLRKGYVEAEVPGYLLAPKWLGPIYKQANLTTKDLGDEMLATQNPKRRRVLPAAVTTAGKLDRRQQRIFKGLEKHVELPESIRELIAKFAEQGERFLAAEGLQLENDGLTVVCTASAPKGEHGDSRKKYNTVFCNRDHEDEEGDQILRIRIDKLGEHKGIQICAITDDEVRENVSCSGFDEDDGVAMLNLMTGLEFDVYCDDQPVMEGCINDGTEFDPEDYYGNIEGNGPGREDNSDCEDSDEDDDDYPPMVLPYINGQQPYNFVRCLREYIQHWGAELGEGDEVSMCLRHGGSAGCFRINDDRWWAGFADYSGCSRFAVTLGVGTRISIVDPGTSCPPKNLACGFD